MHCLESAVISYKSYAVMKGGLRIRCYYVGLKSLCELSVVVDKNSLSSTMYFVKCVCLYEKQNEGFVARLLLEFCLRVAGNHIL